MNVIADKNKIERPWSTDMDDLINGLYALFLLITIDYCKRPELAEKNLDADLLIMRIPLISTSITL